MLHLSINPENADEAISGLDMGFRTERIPRDNVDFTEIRDSTADNAAL